MSEPQSLSEVSIDSGDAGSIQCHSTEEDLKSMEPDDEPVVSNPMQGKGKSCSTYTPPPPRTSSPDPANRDARNSRYSVDGVIDKHMLKAMGEEAMGIIDSDELDKEDGLRRKEPLGPQMYQWEFIGLYAHYAAVGLSGGIQGLSLNFCYYYYKGANNVCANSASMIMIPWGFKIFYAMVCDSFRPFGMRRKPYMIAGWAGVLLTTLYMAIGASQLNAESWVAVSILTQAFLMLADVPADGYSVEMGQLEPPEERGQILATGQRIRFIVAIFAGAIQALLVNGRSTNKAPCAVSFSECWAWGFTPNGYYALIFCLTFILCIPIYYLKEPSSRNHPIHDFARHKQDLWATLMNPTSLFLLIFVIGNGIFSAMSPITQTYTQYNIIGLTNFQSGIMTVLTNFATMGGIIVFQKYFINWNWRYTQYLSLSTSALLGLLWLLVYYDVGGTMNPWFTIFLQLNVALSQGLAQVLYAMAVIELAKKGQESTTYELIVSCGNSASTISSIIATQLLSTVHSTTCNSPTGKCPHHEVNTLTRAFFQATNGPNKFMVYTWMIFGINMAGMYIFTRFLPIQKKQCQEWKDAGNTFVNSANPIVAWFTPSRVGYSSAFLATITILYQVISAGVLLNPDTACLAAFGGEGCPG